MQIDEKYVRFVQVQEQQLSHCTRIAQKNRQDLCASGWPCRDARHFWAGCMGAPWAQGRRERAFAARGGDGVGDGQFGGGSWRLGAM